MTTHRYTTIRMSTKAMADFLYAVIMCKARITGTLTIGTEQYTRKQNAYNGATIMIEIMEGMIPKFEEMIGHPLIKQGPLTVN